ncbi:RagB/SusD family nutrient uptake outer membrane protein [Sphingobacterium yanglingense]|uniref:Putative outer membrane starch-binding protein n=1 Tax=Sphingobacterium yanglingense TaxID=1437280 RepID=A0A4R6WIW9_9SPHI|nr:RagB/SusD family nutrient uptake outer membrane protein [Sphingobacterium yanglingense]TDQ77904.1 putative outer membrane starch-binding protein [Sphingobacterium yanglingense]
MNLKVNTLKNIKLHLFVLVLATIGLLPSCQKGLGLNPKDKISDENLWKNQELVLLYTNNFYSQMRSGFNSTIGSTWLLSSITDDAMVPSTSSQARTVYANPSYTAASSPMNSIFSSRYSYIRRANLYLANIDQVPGDPALNKRLKAEVRFLRAYYYYDLVSFFGGVPIITKAQEYDEDLFLPRNTLDECYDFIEAELDLAANELPAKYPASDLGRITKQAAWALKCRIQMMREHWEQAALTAQTIISMGEHNLLSDYTAVFTSRNNNEVLLAVQHNDRYDELGTQFDKYTFSPYYGGQGNNCPTQNLVDAYQMKATGKEISDPTSGYDPTQPYLGRDPRFYATILYDGVAFKSRIMQMYTGGEDITVNTIAGITADKITPTGYYLKKFTNENYNPNGDPNGRSGYNWPLIRYAEILLNYAESKNEASGPDATVYEAVNKVRQRAGMPKLDESFSQADMRTAIRHERRIELAFEDFRYWDIKRWKLGPALLTNITNPIRKVTITKNAQTGQKSYAYSNVTGYPRLFEDKHYLFPIPQVELDKPGSKLEQNPGWK